jgi:hypothetical protein
VQSSYRYGWCVLQQKSDPSSCLLFCTVIPFLNVVQPPRPPPTLCADSYNFATLCKPNRSPACCFALFFLIFTCSAAAASPANPVCRLLQLCNALQSPNRRINLPVPAMHRKGIHMCSSRLRRRQWLHNAMRYSGLLLPRRPNHPANLFMR